MKMYPYIIMILLMSVWQLNAQSLGVEIEQLLSSPNKYKVIDAREAKKYLTSHIDKALNFPADLTYEKKKIDGRIVQASKMQKIIRKLGLNIDDHIVIYDDGKFFDAARLFWAFEVYGFKNVKLLNAGMKQWKKHNLAISTLIPKVKSSNYIVSVNNNRIATKFTTQIATKNPNQTILDARSIKAYNGITSMSKRYGHIPTAIHLEASKNIDISQNVTKLKTSQSLKKLYLDINKNTQVIVYCALGKIASLNYFALRELDYNVANYDASWKEWGNDLRLPIVNPSKNQ